jgi:methionyl-tRNA formyltransferase
MRMVFMGSAPLACACLEALLTARPGQVAAVVCQPDRPKGRNLVLAPCPVKERIRDRGIPILTPDNVNTAESVADLRALAPDLIAVVAYGQILRAPLLGLPRLGCINIHASLLPKYRGAAPIQWAIVRGELESGVTAMYMSARMDAGDIILQRKIPIGPEDTAGALHEAMEREGPAALVEVVEAIEQGSAQRVPQVESEATFAPKLSREDGRIDWTLSAADLHNRVRGFNPWPGCYTAIACREAGGLPLKVWKVRPEAVPSGSEGALPGTVVESAGDGPLVAAGSGAVRLLSVQPQGRKVMSGSAYLCGHGLCKGMILGQEAT